jgi:hypothetical protein
MASRGSDRSQTVVAIKCSTGDRRRTLVRQHVDADTGDLDCEEMLYVAPSAAEDEEAFWAALPDKGEWLPPGPAGEHFDFEDEERMRRLLPRLTAIFYDEDER